ncbi:hypothetical protein HDU76_006684 [Blyttiomyces sp. JEL0837]|nr:hypothetical protein HDU76_006684 [Blyttiomyces sp. JEL0837]
MPNQSFYARIFHRITRGLFNRRQPATTTNNNDGNNRTSRDTLSVPDTVVIPTSPAEDVTVDSQERSPTSNGVATLPQSRTVVVTNRPSSTTTNYAITEPIREEISRTQLQMESEMRARLLDRVQSTRSVQSTSLANVSTSEESASPVTKSSTAMSTTCAGASDSSTSSVVANSTDNIPTIRLSHEERRRAMDQIRAMDFDEVRAMFPPEELLSILRREHGEDVIRRLERLWPIAEARPLPAPAASEVTLVSLPELPKETKTVHFVEKVRKVKETAPVPKKAARYKVVNLTESEKTKVQKKIDEIHFAFHNIDWLKKQLITSGLWESSYTIQKLMKDQKLIEAQYEDMKYDLYYLTMATAKKLEERIDSLAAHCELLTGIRSEPSRLQDDFSFLMMDSTPQRGRPTSRGRRGRNGRDVSVTRPSYITSPNILQERIGMIPSFSIPGVDTTLNNAGVFQDAVVSASEILTGASSSIFEGISNVIQQLSLVSADLDDAEFIVGLLTSGGGARRTAVFMAGDNARGFGREMQTF